MQPEKQEVSFVDICVHYKKRSVNTAITFTERFSKAYLHLNVKARKPVMIDRETS